jgi:hypothetical protein
MIDNGIRIHHHTETVESADQAISLAEYLSQHGVLAFKEADDAVMVAMECPNEDVAAQKERMVHMLVSTWHLFWEHSDRGLFGLPIYVKD